MGRIKRWCLFCVAVFGTVVPIASAKTVSYRGETVRVPNAWPVIDLARHPTTCVRFDRPVVYLGTPSAAQQCPAHAIGRARAILLEPSPSGVRALRSSAAGEPSGGASPAPGNARAASTVYTGKGFDTCTAPSAAKMAAWSASPYRAIGVYIGGVNSACAQPNLTASWVATETAAGWHLILTYVGLQGAGSCGGGCATIGARKAASQGAAAGRDAVSRAAALGIPAGNPIYYDMEAYNRGGSASKTVRTFLSAWTSQLHSKGYLSGVYSSGASGIADLAVWVRSSGFHAPDEIWVADWNGKATTSDPYLPAGEWSNHQRIHQYTGGHNERYGGVKLNVDDDYLDAATASTASGPKPVVSCVVPKLRRMSYKRAKRALRAAHCSLGKVHWPRHWQAHRHHLRVFSQSPRGGTVKPAGYAVRIRLSYRSF